MDQIDHKIIAALQVDGRKSITDLAAHVGISKTPCAARLRKLLSDGILLGFRAVVNHKRLHQNHVAFVEVTLKDTREAALQAFGKAVRTIPEIEECHMIAGAFDYLLKVRTADIDAYRRVLGERISTLPHVASSSTHVAMEAVKEAANGQTFSAIPPHIYSSHSEIRM